MVRAIRSRIYEILEIDQQKFLAGLHDLGGDLIGSPVETDKSVGVRLRNAYDEYQPVISNLLHQGKTVSLSALAHANIFNSFLNSVILSIAGNGAPGLQSIISQDVRQITRDDFILLTSGGEFQSVEDRRILAVNIAITREITEKVERKARTDEIDAACARFSMLLHRRPELLPSAKNMIDKLERS